VGEQIEFSIPAQQASTETQPILTFLGGLRAKITIEEVRAVKGVSRDCVNAAEMARAARHYGLEGMACTRGSGW